MIEWIGDGDTSRNPYYGSAAVLVGVTGRVQLLYLPERWLGVDDGVALPDDAT